MEAVVGVFTIVFLISIVLMFSSLFTIKLAIFSKEKTKMKAFLTWLICAILAIILVNIFFEPEDTQQVNKQVLEQDDTSELSKQSSEVEDTPQQVPQKEQKTLDYTKSEIINTYNAIGKALNLPTVDMNNYKFGSGINDTYTYVLTPFTNVILTCLPNTDKLVSVFFIGAGDGSEISAMSMILSAIATFTSLTPELSGEQRGDYLDEIGIISGTLKLNTSKEVEIGNMLISVSLSDITGLTMIASAK